MARTTTPEAHLRTLRAALRVAIDKGMAAEAKQVTILIRDCQKKMELAR